MFAPSYFLSIFMFLINPFLNLFRTDFGTPRVDSGPKYGVDDPYHFPERPGPLYRVHLLLSASTSSVVQISVLGQSGSTLTSKPLTYSAGACVHFDVVEVLILLSW